MKKIVILFVIAFLQCSHYPKNGIAESNHENPILVTEIITYKDEKQNINKITYNGNKIVSQNNTDGFIINYTYTGDFITKIEAFDDEQKPYFTHEYTYVNGKIDTSIYYSYSDDSSTTEFKYTHNADGTVSYDIVYTETSVGLPYVANGKYTFSNGNLIEAVYSSNDGRKNVVTYKYDKNNNVFKNVVGFNLLLDNKTCSVNNVVTMTQKLPDINPITTTFVYKYDSKNFPIEAIETDVDETSTNIYKIIYRY
ncbi:MAG: hypothetical protein ABI554_09965 [Flavobacterium sp.]